MRATGKNTSSGGYAAGLELRHLIHRSKSMKKPEHNAEESSTYRLEPLPTLIFSSRWLQLPLYLGLIVAQGVYVVLFVKELLHLVHGAFEMNEQQVMLIVLAVLLPIIQLNTWVK